MQWTDELDKRNKNWTRVEAGDLSALLHYPLNGEDSLPVSANTLNHSEIEEVEKSLKSN